MTQSTNKEAVDSLREKIKGIHMAMLTTLSEDKIVSRPMATQEMGPDGTLWFLTSEGSNKVGEITANPTVGIAYSDSGSECYVSISGTASVTNDRELIHKFWNPFYKAWFESPEDPSIRVLQITPTSAEYWDTKGGKIVSLLSMAASAITGKDMEAGENETVSLG